MSRLPAPLDPNNWNGHMITNDGGIGPVGRISDLTGEEIDGSLHVNWTLELADDVAESEVAVFVFVDGELAEPVTGVNAWVYTPQKSTVVEKIDFILAPNETRWSTHMDVLPINNRVRLNWSHSSEAKSFRIVHCYGSGTPTTTVATLSRIAARDNITPGAVSGNLIHAGGVWEDPDTLYTSVHVAITKSGLTGVAEYTWAWGTWSGTGVTQYYPDRAMNGLRINFDAGQTYSVGDAWDIEIGLPLEWDSGNLSTGGPSTYGVNTINSAGDATTGPTVEVDLYIPPAAPTLLTPTYVEGSGSIYISWLAPSAAASGLDLYRVYRNYAHDGVRVVDYTPVASDVIAVGETIDEMVTGLEEGYNRVQCVVVDGEGLESDLSEVWEITLDANLYQVGTDPNVPDSISAEMDAAGDIEVTVVADDTSTEIDLFHDSRSGTINYTTVQATITNPREGMFQSLTATLSAGLSDGIYMIGARARNHTIYELNTDLWCTVLRDKDASLAVTSLTAEVID